MMWKKFSDEMPENNKLILIIDKTIENDWYENDINIGPMLMVTTLCGTYDEKDGFLYNDDIEMSYAISAETTGYWMYINDIMDGIDNDNKQYLGI